MVRGRPSASSRSDRWPVPSHAAHAVGHRKRALVHGPTRVMTPSTASGHWEPAPGCQLRRPRRPRRSPDCRTPRPSARRRRSPRRSACRRARCRCTRGARTPSAAMSARQLRGSHARALASSRPRPPRRPSRRCPRNQGIGAELRHGRLGEVGVAHERRCPAPPAMHARVEPGDRDGLERAHAAAHLHLQARARQDRAHHWPGSQGLPDVAPSRSTTCSHVAPGLLEQLRLRRPGRRGTRSRAS